MLIRKYLECFLHQNIFLRFEMSIRMTNEIFHSFSEKEKSDFYINPVFLKKKHQAFQSEVKRFSNFSSFS